MENLLKVERRTSTYAATLMERSHSAAEAVGEQLREAFAAVNTADLPGEEKGRWQHRLLAITNMAKRDVGRAEEQLRRWNDDWHARVSVSPNEQDR